MVTPSKMTVSYLSLKSGQTKDVQYYLADAVGTVCKSSLDGVPSATAGEDFQQFTGPVRIIDVSIVTGPTVITSVALRINGIRTGDAFDKTSRVSTAIRTPLRVDIPAMARISFVEQ